MGQEASGGAWWCVEVEGIRLGKGDSRSLSRLKSVSGLACSLVCTFHVALKTKNEQVCSRQGCRVGVFRWGGAAGAHKHVAKTNSKKEEAPAPSKNRTKTNRVGLMAKVLMLLLQLNLQHPLTPN